MPHPVPSIPQRLEALAQIVSLRLPNREHCLFSTAPMSSEWNSTDPEIDPSQKNLVTNKFKELIYILDLFFK